MARWRGAIKRGICRLTCVSPMLRSRFRQSLGRSDRLGSQPRRNWNENFDLKKAPPIWKAAQGSGRKAGEGD